MKVVSRRQRSHGRGGGGAYDEKAAKEGAMVIEEDGDTRALLIDKPLFDKTLARVNEAM